MQIEDMEPMSIPPMFTDLFGILLFIFIDLTCILAGSAVGTREVRLALPEVDKVIAAERGAGDGVEVVIRRTGVLVVNGKEIAAASELERLVGPGKTVAIIIEKGATAEALITVEGFLKKSGVREVSVLVKEAL